MTEVAVTFRHRESGIAFGIGPKQHVLSRVSRGSIAQRSGLLCGDELVAINGISIHSAIQMIASGMCGFANIAELFDSQQPPFSATFKRKILRKPTASKSKPSSTKSALNQLRIDTKSSPQPSRHVQNSGNWSCSTMDSFSLKASRTPTVSFSSSCALAITSTPRYSTSLSAFSVGCLENGFPALSSKDRIAAHVTQRSSIKHAVCFDKICVTDSPRQKVLFSKGLQRGFHRFSLEIVRCDVESQRIGVASSCSEQFGAHAVYGNEMATGSSYYASCNDNGAQRCFRNLSNSAPNRNWCTGDVVTVCLDLTHYRIKFLLNGRRVGKTMSLQKQKVYYPMLSFAGNCHYKLLS